jgi:hypothetical protein
MRVLEHLQELPKMTPKLKLREFIKKTSLTASLNTFQF